MVGAFLREIAVAVVVGVVLSAARGIWVLGLRFGSRKFGE